MVKSFKILSLDGGGSKGVYSIGFLSQLETYLGGAPLGSHFDLIYGTSTGAIIGSLIGLGEKADNISRLYRDIIPDVMPKITAKSRSIAINKHAENIFSDKRPESFITPVSIVTTNKDFNKPTIFKSDIGHIYKGKSDFRPWFGCTIQEGVLASAAATPFFLERTISGDGIKPMRLVDGGFVANNPILFALTDATQSIGIAQENIKVLSVGVGRYSENLASMSWWELFKNIRNYKSKPLELLETAMSTSSNSSEMMANLLFNRSYIVRVNEPLLENKFKTNLLDYNQNNLNKMENHGRNSFRVFEDNLRKFFE